MRRTTAATSKSTVASGVTGELLVTLQLAPVPASRPRFRVIKTKFGKQFVHTYYAGAYKTFLEQAKGALLERVPLEGLLEVSIDCYVEKPKTSKRSTPRGDVDNYAKGVLDVLTDRKFWGDDDQVVALQVTKSFSDRPRIEVTIREIS